MVDEPEPIEEPAPEAREIPNVEAMRANIKPVPEDAFTLDAGLANAGVNQGTVFAPITQTGGDTYNTNASVSMGMSSSHTDETARILSESVYN